MLRGGTINGSPVPGTRAIGETGGRVFFANETLCGVFVP